VSTKLDLKIYSVLTDSSVRVQAKNNTSAYIAKHRFIVLDAEQYNCRYQVIGDDTTSEFRPSVGV
jgi:hypothetical protein